MKSLFLISLLFCQFSMAQFQKLQLGTPGCGFISLTRYDSSRPPVIEQSALSKGRIIQINIWYPTFDSFTTYGLHFKDYVDLIGNELNEAEKDPAAIGFDRYFAWPASLGADRKAFTDFLGRSPMLAATDRLWDRKNNPLVLLVHGFAADHAYLAEYLAGHGYMVLQVPVKGSLTYELDFESGGLEAQVLDYEYALHIAQKELGISPPVIGVAGFSFGGQSAIALALRNSSVKAITSLDGGIGSVFGAGLLRKQPYYDSKKIDQPILHLYNATDTYTDLSWFDEVTNSHRVMLAMKSMQHGHFTSFGLLNKYIPGIMGTQYEDPRDGYEAVMQTTKTFFDTYLKSKAGMTSQFVEKLIDTDTWIKDYLSVITVKPAGS